MSSFLHYNDYQTDEALVAMLRSGPRDELALKEIFNRYSHRLYGMAAGVLHDDALARDLVQDVFIDLWNRRRTSNIERLSAYLTRAIKFQVLKQLRNGKLHERHLRIIHKLQFINQTEESINFRELEQLLEDSIAQLPPRCKEVFFLSRFENMTNKEISARLNISTKTVEGQITRALSFLRTTLSKTIVLAFWLAVACG